METIIPFILASICFFVPASAIIHVLKGRSLDGLRIINFIFSGVLSRIVYVFLSVITASGFNKLAVTKENLSSPVVLTTAVLLLVLIYSQVMIKSLVRQSEIISRFFLDSLPSQQLGVDLEYRQQAITLSSLRRKKANLLRDSLQLGSLEGVLRWLVADLWIVLVGSFLISLSKLKGNYSDLLDFHHLCNFINSFSSYALILILACIMNAVPLIAFFSQGTLRKSEEDMHIYSQDNLFSLITGMFLSALLVSPSRISDYLWIAGTVLIIVLLARFYLRRSENKQYKLYKYIRQGDVFVLSTNALQVKDSTCKIELPSLWFAELEDQLQNYLKRSGINLLPNVICDLIVEFVEGTQVKISYGIIEGVVEFASAHCEQSIMESRVFKPLASDFSRVVNDGHRILNLESLPTLSIAIKEFLRNYSRFDSPISSIQRYIDFLLDKEHSVRFNVSRLTLSQLGEISSILGRLLSLGYSYVPVEVFSNISEMVGSEEERDDIVKCSVRELVNLCPQTLHGKDGLMRVLSIENLVGSIGQLEINRILYLANELEERNLAPMVLRVEDLVNVRVKALTEQLLESGLDVKFLDIETKLGANFYPLGMV